MMLKAVNFTLPSVYILVVETSCKHSIENPDKVEVDLYENGKWSRSIFSGYENSMTTGEGYHTLEKLVDMVLCEKENESIRKLPRFFIEIYAN